MLKQARLPSCLLNGKQTLKMFKMLGRGVKKYLVLLLSLTVYGGFSDIAGRSGTYYPAMNEVY